VFTVPALLWFFSILLAKFYREVKYYHGLGSPRLLEKVILPFLDIQESVCYKERYTLLGRDSEGSLIVAPWHVVQRRSNSKAAIPLDTANFGTRDHNDPKVWREITNCGWPFKGSL